MIISHRIFELSITLQPKQTLTVIDKDSSTSFLIQTIGANSLCDVVSCLLINRLELLLAVKRHLPASSMSPGLRIRVLDATKACQVH